MKCMLLVFALCFVPPAVAQNKPASPKKSVLVTTQRKNELLGNLLKDKKLNPDYIRMVFDDTRLTVYEPPPPAPPSPPGPAPRRRVNPYLTERFGLLTDVSFERCRTFYRDHQETMDAAHDIFGVPKEVICGILRIETNFGIPTKLSPSPFGSRPIVNSLYSMYVRRPLVCQGSGSKRKCAPMPQAQFTRRQQFALGEMRHLFSFVERLQWDPFSIPGSPTGAFGLPQFQPSSFPVAIDGNGDGDIDLFNPHDAVMSVANYLVSRGWDKNKSHQDRAIARYYGIRKGERYQDSHYMIAIRKYEERTKKYFDANPIVEEFVFVPEPISLTEDEKAFLGSYQPIETTHEPAQ
ncbi:MAG: hypothetical protein A2945_03960 [Candidatus Liptonbacteria bacterium RIFCSPLOWO2_01_FULL_52_25]|uniref:Transglycosylase SLT domain-containing protein n=1 Tax=Candidatus Liptonbacteria bacterium RIFCSPLOWO2_01_FULL_52_25 TaxID=1798650 RepID=A0A1G2CC61_9BACT|nr:MAG: hypothetical protein A2945_03960 [Candidatus Liptonbacteria bacterium RIFCSPLOWO2_01_FULL_52_25]